MKLIALLALFLPITLVSQIDQEFWFVAPEVTEGHGDRPILLRMTAQFQPANVSIQMPANPGFPGLSIAIPANTSRTVDLTPWIQQIETVRSGISNTGVFIQSDELISVYYEVDAEFNPDIFTLKGQNALGRTFFTPNQTTWGTENNYGFAPPPLASVLVVATEDNTAISFTSHHPDNIQTPRSLVLNRGQTYALRTTKNPGSRVLTGIEIRANKNIAVTISEDSQFFNPCADLSGDQIIPVDRLGTEYVITRGELQPNDLVFVTATAMNTTITFHTASGTREEQLTVGEQYAFPLSDPILYISSTENIYVLHATGNSCEIGQAIIPQITCTGSNFVQFARSSNLDLFVILITQKGNEEFFQFESGGQTLPLAPFEEVPGNPNFVAALTRVTNGGVAGSTYSIRNDEGLFHFGFINGGEDNTGSPVAARYGYLSSFQQLQVLGYQANVCLGDTINLRAIGSQNYEWEFNTGDVMLTDSIDFIVEEDFAIKLLGFFGDDFCKDSLELDFFANPLPPLTIEFEPFCENTTAELFLQLDSSEIQTSTWVFNKQDTLVSDFTGQIQYDVGSGDSLLIDLTVKGINGCLTDSVFLLPVQGLSIDLDSSIVVDQNEDIFFQPNLQFRVLEGDENEFMGSWYFEDSLLCMNCTFDAFQPDRTGTYRLFIEDVDGCFQEDSIFVQVRPNIFVPSAFSPGNDMLNETFAPYGTDFTLENLKIYNRWGGLLYDGMEAWDGTVNGELVDSGTYLYILELFDRVSNAVVQRQGSVHVVR